MIGSLLGNRYEIIEKLGGGGMAVVYKGRDTILNRLVTIKVLRQEFTSDEEFVKRFRSEAQAVASLSHPNIVSIYDVGRVDDVDYLVMEYIEGDNLKTLIKQKGPLLPAKAALYAMQIGLALEHAHENHIVHRDVKPQNILITKDGRAKLTDFGIAMGATSTTIAKSEGVMGSVHYVSPEQAKGDKTGPYSDIYSLGVVLYEMATNILPFQGETPVGVAMKHIQEEPPLPSRINPAISVKLENIILQAMAKNPNRRFDTARLMVQELAVIAGTAGEELTQAPEDEFETRLIPTVGDLYGEGEAEAPKRKSPPKGLLIAVGIFIVLFAAGAWFYQGFFNVKEVEMPNLYKMTEDEAVNKLAELGLINPHVNREFRSDVAAGLVYYQNPVKEIMVKTTRQVELGVSLGTEKIEAPNVVGKDVEVATASLQEIGFTLESVELVYNDLEEQGTVLDQYPKPGDKVDKGTPVALTVSNGKRPVSVPYVIGMHVEQARAALKDIKLVSEERTLVSELYDRYIVFEQQPGANAELKEGEAVYLTVSAGPGPTPYTAQVETVISDNRIHQLRIEISDLKGDRTALDETLDQKGLIVRSVTYYGRATIKAYLNDTLQSTKIHEGGEVVEE